jgi:hypothetical protein
MQLVDPDRTADGNYVMYPANRRTTDLGHPVHLRVGDRPRGRRGGRSARSRPPFGPILRASLQTRPGCVELRDVNRSDEMPLTRFLDTLSGMCERNQLSVEELAQYHGLCALEAAMIETEVYERASWASGRPDGQQIRS